MWFIPVRPDDGRIEKSAETCCLSFDSLYHNKVLLCFDLPTLSIVILFTSVRLSAWDDLVSIERIFMTFDIWVCFEILSRTFSFIKIRQKYRVLNMKTGIQYRVLDMKTNIQYRVLDMKTNIQNRVLDMKTNIQYRVLDMKTNIQNRIIDMKTNIQYRVLDMKTNIQNRIIDMKTNTQYRVLDMKTNIQNRIIDMKTNIQYRVLDMKTNIYSWSYLAQFFLEWNIFQTKCVDKIETRTLFSITFFKTRDFIR
jgi:hypothetical protein